MTSTHQTAMDTSISGSLSCTLANISFRSNSTWLHVLTSNFFASKMVSKSTSTCVSRHLQLRTGVSCRCNISLPACPCWWQPAHLASGVGRCSSLQQCYLHSLRTTRITDQQYANEYLQCCWHIYVWVDTGWFLASSRRYCWAVRRRKSVASRLEAVESSRCRRQHTVSDCRSSPDIPAPTWLRRTDPLPLSSDSRVSPTPDCNIHLHSATNSSMQVILLLYFAAPFVINKAYSQETQNHSLWGTEAMG